MGTESWAWLLAPRDEVIDPDHPDYEYWREAAALPWPESRAMPPPMTATPKSPEVPAVALAVSREQAAALLSVSVDTFDRRVLPDLRVVNKGRRVLVPVRELEVWLEANAARALKGR